MILLLGAAGIVAGLSYALVRERARVGGRRSRFQSRQSRSLSEIFQQEYVARGIDYDAFAALWTKMATTLHLDPGRLLPSDRFSVELAPPPGHELADELEEVGELLQDAASARGITLDPKEIEKIDDVVLLLCRPPPGGLQQQLR